MVVEGDGTVRWRKSVSNLSSDSICDFDDAGRVYANSFDGVRAFAADGSPLWTLPARGGGYRNHAGPTVGPDGNIYFVDFTVGGYGFASATPSGELRWSMEGFGPLGGGPRKIDVVFTEGRAVVSAPETPFDCDGDCLSSGVVANRLDGTFSWKADTTTPNQPTVTADGRVLSPVAPTGVVTIDPSSGLPSPVSLGNHPNTGPVVATGSDGAAYAVTRFDTVLKITPDGELSELAMPGAIMGTPAISPDGGLMVVGVADSLLPSPNFVAGIDTATGDTLWLLPLPVENGWQLTATGWPRFAEDGRAVFVGVNAGNESYLYAVNICGGPSDNACAADINTDGVLTGADFNAWVTAFGDMDSRADQNNDGAFTGADFNAFLTNFSAGCP